MPLDIHLFNALINNSGAKLYGMQTSHLSPMCIFITAVANPSPKELTRYDAGIMVAVL